MSPQSRIILTLAIVAALAIAAPALATHGALTTPSSVAPTADEVLTALKEGNARFVAGTPQHPHSGMDRVIETSAGQTPMATVIGCSDSRVALERLFDRGIGDLFVVRVAGNVADTDEIGSAEYGTGHLHTPLMIILGHTKCGAVSAVASGAALHGSIPSLVDNIIPAVERARHANPGVSDKDLIPFAVRENVFESIASTLTHSQEIRDLVTEGKLRVVGAVYDIDTGIVDWLGEHPAQSALLTPSTTSIAQASGDHASIAQASDDHASIAQASGDHASIAQASGDHATIAPSHAATTATAASASSSHSAEASTLAATGTFVAPELKIAARAAFGAAAGKPNDFEVLEVPAQSTNALSLIFAAAAAAAFVATLVAGHRLARTVSPDGVVARTLTLGTKLAFGFGILAVGILAIATVATNSNQQVASSMHDMEERVAEVGILEETKLDLASMRIAVKAFLISNSEQDLRNYSDATASFSNKVAQAKSAITNPEHASKFVEIEKLLKEYEDKFAQAVARIDERNGVIDSQMNVAAARASKLLTEIATTAHADGDTAKALVAAEAGEHFQSARLSFFKYLRSHDDKLAEEATAQAVSMGTLVTELRGQITNPKRVAWLTEAALAATYWTDRMQHAIELQHERDQLVRQGLDQIGPKINQEASTLAKALLAEQSQSRERADEAAASARTLVSTFSAAIVIFAIIIAVVIVRSVLAPLSALVASIIEIQRTRDLTRRTGVTSSDEVGRVGQCFDGLVSTLHGIIRDVSSGASEIDAGATQIASASQSLAEGASRQAASLEEISASIEEMSSMTRQNADNARSANEVSEASQTAARNGQREMQQMSTAMSEIKDSSAEIAKIIKVIDEIAFQTNLLALNAAVEAARAGEAGKGFAVVAEEVRSLAQRSAEAAKSTAAMIDDSTARANRGVEIAGRVGQSLDEIASATTRVNALLTEIASACDEQSKGIHQVNTGVTELDRVTQTNAGNSEELASGAEETASQVSSLQALVSQFKTEGSTTASTAPRKGAAHAAPHATAHATPPAVHALKLRPGLRAAA
jgi:methyl-accepting chemotaxis protein